jgi:hypothetical protein
MDPIENTVSNSSSVVAWLFDAAETRLPCRCLRVDAFSESAVSAFFRHDTIIKSFSTRTYLSLFLKTVLEPNHHHIQNGHSQLAKQRKKDTKLTEISEPRGATYVKKNNGKIEKLLALMMRFGIETGIQQYQLLYLSEV